MGCRIPAATFFCRENTGNDESYEPEHEQKKQFESGATALVPIDGTDTYWTAEDASNFDEVFGTNTDYVIDPEECMADNFSYLITYGMDGPEGKGYPNPEIIQGIADILTK